MHLNDKIHIVILVDADAGELAQVGVASEAVLFQEQLAAAREVRCAWQRDVLAISNRENLICVLDFCLIDF